MNAGTKHGYNRSHVVRQLEDWERAMFPQDCQRRPVVMHLTPEEAALIRTRRRMWEVKP